MARRKFTAADRANNVLVGKRLRKVLEAYQFSQVAFAGAIGVSQSGLSEVLSGENALDVNVARTIRDRFGVSLDYLYCNDHGSLPLDLAHAILRGEPLTRTKRAR